MNNQPLKDNQQVQQNSQIEPSLNQQQNHHNDEVQQPPTQATQSHHQKSQNHQSKSQIDDQQIPQHFYDSDIASVCQKDFQSDNQPPKDIVQQRKLLYKQKLMHVYKTIIRVGSGIDKPARYDRIKLKHREVPKNQIPKNKKHQKIKAKGKVNQLQENELDHGENVKVAENEQILQKQIADQKSNEKTEQKTELNTNEQQSQIKPKSQAQKPLNKQSKQQQPQSQPVQISQLPVYYSTSYVQQCQTLQYNIGNQRQQIQRLVSSMKKGQTALFQLQLLTVSKKSNIKIRTCTQIHVIHSIDWTTVIDLEGDKKFLKYVHTKGEGPFRVATHDKITFSYCLKRSNVYVRNQHYVKKQIQKQFIKQQLSKVVWRVLNSMKQKQSVSLQIKEKDLQQIQGQQSYQKLQQQFKNTSNSQTLQSDHQALWNLTISIQELIKVDDVYLDGRILKQTLMKGVSTAKPYSSSLVFYALKFINDQQQVLKVDECFDSDWWEDFGVLDQLKGIRKNYLDDYKISKMLKKAIKRMKPAEIALVECRDNQLFQYGAQFDSIKELLKFTEVPQRVKIIVRVYNFTQAKTAFNMQIQQKIIESRRKKQVAIKLLSQNKIQKALKRFQNIISFYSSQKINQQAYDQKVSALMNAILCYMKLKKYPQMITLCNQILLKPRHGHQFKDIKIVGPGHAKIEGNLNKQNGEGQGSEQVFNGDTRRIAIDLVQNQKIVDKCLYRKGFALFQLGQCEQSLKSLNQISETMSSTEEVIKLKAQATKGKQKYEQKSKRIFKTMFG